MNKKEFHSCNERLLTMYAVGKSYKEMAAVLGISPTAVGTQIYEARKAGLIQERRIRRTPPEALARVYEMYCAGRSFDDIEFETGVPTKRIRWMITNGIRKGLIQKRKLRPTSAHRGDDTGLKRMEAQLNQQRRVEFLNRPKASEFLSFTQEVVW